ncbi:MAG: phage tail tape measure protein [Pseudomonadota bacterium]
MGELRTQIAINVTGDLERRIPRYNQTLENFSRRGQRNLGLMTRAAHGLGRALDSAGNRWTATLAGGAAAYKAYHAAVQSAGLDKTLIQVAQTAGATAEMAKVLRAELHTMAKSTGQNLDDLLQGFNNLIQAGQTWEQALATIQAINPAIAVTGANANTLAAGLTVAAQAFDFDLSKLQTSKDLLDQMVVAGRLGNAELEDLSAIFARVGVNAKTANLSFSQTLGFIEQLSLIERDPARLSTLADSTLRLFTNQQYMKRAAGATGVSFYDKTGAKRGAFDVLQDIARKYQSQTTARGRDTFMARAFQGVDLDTMKGLRTLFSGDALFQVGKMTAEIEKAGGTIARDLPGAINDAVDQVGRLKAALREAADGFAQPVNDAITTAIKYLMRESSWDQAGAGLSGKEMLGGGVLAAGALFAGTKLSGKLLQRVGGVGAGVAVGKAMEEFAGVTPVYVVNMPGGGLPGMPGGGKGIPGLPGGASPKIPSGWRAGARMLFSAQNMRTIGALGLGAMSTAGGLVAASGAAGWGAGRFIDRFMLNDSQRDAIGGTIATILARFGSKEARSALDQRFAELNGTLKFELVTPPGVTVRPIEARTNSGVSIDIERGLNTAGGA